MPRAPYNTTFDVYDPMGVWNNPSPLLIYTMNPGRIVEQHHIDEASVLYYPITAWVTTDWFSLVWPLIANFTGPGQAQTDYRYAWYISAVPGGPPVYALVGWQRVTEPTRPTYYRYLLTDLPLPW